MSDSQSLSDRSWRQVDGGRVGKEPPRWTVHIASDGRRVSDLEPRIHSDRPVQVVPAEDFDRLRAENERLHAMLKASEEHTQHHEGEAKRLREALIGGDPNDPRWTWLPGVIERLEEYAPADEDQASMYEAARVLQAMVSDLRAALAFDETEGRSDA